MRPSPWAGSGHGGREREALLHGAERGSRKRSPHFPRARRRPGQRAEPGGGVLGSPSHFRGGGGRRGRQEAAVIRPASRAPPRRRSHDPPREASPPAALGAGSLRASGQHWQVPRGEARAGRQARLPA